MQATDCRHARRDTDDARGWEARVAAAQDLPALGRLIREEAARRAAAAQIPTLRSGSKSSNVVFRLPSDRQPAETGQ